MADVERRAYQARDALENPILTESLTFLSQHYLAQLRNCDAKDDLGRYRYAVALNVVDAVGRHLKTVLETGQLEAKQQQELKTPKRWAPSF